MLGSSATWWMWAFFGLVVAVMLFLDLAVFHRKAHAVTAKEAAIWTAVWIAVALAFDVGVYFFLGRTPAIELLTAYVVEKALSVDNLFVFYVVFGYFAVPPQYQHRVLFWGVFGALVMRAIFIFVGVVLIQKFAWIMYVFGAFLVFTGIRILVSGQEKIHPEHNPMVKLVRRLMPVAKDYDGAHFFTMADGKRLATPMLLVLVVVEATDLVFAVDSIPAVLAISTDPFIVFTSNILAILGLRSLYFLIARVIDRLRYLKVGLGVVLAFVGVKMFGARWFHVPVEWSLTVIVGVLALSMLASLLLPRRA
jgi:tellurite resistance protein TerC